MLKWLRFKSMLHYCREKQILCIDSWIYTQTREWILLADTTVRIMSDSLLQARLRSLSQAHLCVYLNICMAYSPGLFHAAVVMENRQSQPQNICALSQITQRRVVLPYVDAAIPTTCFIHEKKSLDLSLSVSLDLFFSSPLLFFVFGQSIPVLSVRWLLEQSGNGL